MEGMRAELDQLKRDAESAFAPAADVRAAMEELVELKSMILSALREVEPLVGAGDAGLESQVVQTKSLVRELQLQLENRSSSSHCLFSRFAPRGQLDGEI